ncbi:hypothetical protein HAP94_10820 [Acidithiobacillus ferrivorans]|nr:hypothetical protein [Acidithiobacillus ferrivorans]
MPAAVKAYRKPAQDMAWRIGGFTILLISMTGNMWFPGVGWLVASGIAGACCGLPPSAWRITVQTWLPSKEKHVFHMKLPSGVMQKVPDKWRFIGFIKEKIK